MLVLLILAVTLVTGVLSESKQRHLTQFQREVHQRLTRLKRNEKGLCSLCGGGFYDPKRGDFYDPEQVVQPEQKYGSTTSTCEQEDIKFGHMETSQCVENTAIKRMRDSCCRTKDLSESKQRHLTQFEREVHQSLTRLERKEEGRCSLCGGGDFYDPEQVAQQKYGSTTTCEQADIDVGNLETYKCDNAGIKRMREHCCRTKDLSERKQRHLTQFEREVHQSLTRLERKEKGRCSLCGDGDFYDPEQVVQQTQRYGSASTCEQADIVAGHMATYRCYETGISRMRDSCCRTKEKPCKDEYDSCGKYAANCKKERWKEYMSHNCKKSCGLCSIDESYEVSTNGLGSRFNLKMMSLVCGTILLSASFCFLYSYRKTNGEQYATLLTTESV